ncbi:MAG: hypothetical protein WA364_04375 [Candidatus Nitrosopolaris sp.]
MKYQNSEINTGWKCRPESGTKSTIIEGVIPIVCIFCRFITCVEFDLEIHLYESHRMELVKLPIGKGSFDFRIKYAIEEGRRVGQALNKYSSSKERPGFFDWE